MTLIINVLFAWVSVVLAALLSVIYLLRVINKKFFNNKISWMTKLNKVLRRNHKWMGIALIVTSLIHGLYSSMAVLSTNKGTLMFVLIILLGLSYMFKKQLGKFKGFMFYHRVLTALTVVFFFLHMIEVGWAMGPDDFFTGVEYELQADNQIVEVQVDEEVAVELGEDVTDSVASELDGIVDGNVYNDGIYTGEATGYRAGLVVEVTIENNLITRIEVVDHNERNERFYGEPIATIPGDIIDGQNPIVDTISGATMTSTGIINATIDALNQALVSGQVPDELELRSSGRH